MSLQNKVEKVIGNIEELIEWSIKNHELNGKHLHYENEHIADGSRIRSNLQNSLEQLHRCGD